MRCLIWTLDSPECVALAKACVDAPGSVWHWERGDNAIDHVLPPGTPVASFLTRDGRTSRYYDAHEGVGISGNHTSHAAVVRDYIRAEDGRIEALRLFEIYPGSKGLRKRIYPVDDCLFGTRNARNFWAINDADGTPLGGLRNPYYRLLVSTRR